MVVIANTAPLPRSWMDLTSSQLLTGIYYNMERQLRFLMLNWRDPQNPASGGAERVSLAYLSALSSKGHDVWWFANAYPDCEQESILNGIHIIRRGGMGTSILAANRWFQSQARFDLVIDQHHGIPWFAPWWTQTQCVSYIHEVLGPIWSSFYRWPLDQIGRIQEQFTHWLYRQTPFWTACKGTEDMLHARGIQSVKRIPYGVYTQALPSLPEKLMSAPLRLAVVSRLAPNKRIDHAIRTLRCLKDRQIDAALKIIGTGDSMPQLKQCVGQLGLNDRVTFAGFLDEKQKDQSLQEAHILLHTSVREGWGLNIIEANAMGTPSAVYPVAGLTESTLDHVTGRISKKETPESLADEIQSMIKKPERYQQYRIEAWNRAKQFHWDAILPKACDWLESMALKGSPGP